MILMSFADAVSESSRYRRRHLLLGNGFSIACRPDIFVYGKLFEQADFSKLSPSARDAFAALGTQDFERVVRALRDASSLASLYSTNPDLAAAMTHDADGLRNLLVSTIAASHPERPSDITDAEYRSCRGFLTPFSTVYTLNYDLLLYWAQMHVGENEQPSSDDGFRKSEDDYEARYVVWESHQSHGQDTWFLHGALHVFDSGSEVRKFTWVNTGVRLIEQIRDALERNYYPLFVSEGSSDEKLARIKHSDYLAKGYRSFTEIGGCLFVYGHSLAANDEHYLKRIERGKVQHLYVGIYGDPDSPGNKAIVRRAHLMPTARIMAKGKPLEVSFYDASTVRIWR
jgi:hypothetical protein